MTRVKLLSVRIPLDSYIIYIDISQTKNSTIQLRGTVSKTLHGYLITCTMCIRKYIVLAYTSFSFKVKVLLQRMRIVNFYIIYVKLTPSFNTFS